MWPYKSPHGTKIPRKAISVPEPVWRAIRDSAAEMGMTITQFLYEVHVKGKRELVKEP